MDDKQENGGPEVEVPDVLVASTSATYRARDGRTVRIRRGRTTAIRLDPRVAGFEHFFVPLVPTFNERGVAGRRARR
jgi:hypothetical protein